MKIIFCVLWLLVISGTVSLLLNRFRKQALIVSISGNILGSILGLVSVIIFLIKNYRETELLFFIKGIGNISFTIDPLASFFLLIVFLLSPLAAFYSLTYLVSWLGKKSLGTAGFFFNMLTAGMILVFISSNALAFLISWEIMTLASFFLVIFENEKEKAVKAGILYLSASYIGSILLFFLFIFLGNIAGSYDFRDFYFSSEKFLPHAGIIFTLALAGFGIKAGFIPMHVWLPEAHPEAPSHVSSVMSGLMIKTGIYAIIRTIMFIHDVNLTMAWVMLGFGVLSGILGALFTIAQKELKKLLAYSSIENMGIIALGMSLGFFGIAFKNPVLTILGFTAALLHCLNHALFKGLLFLSAGQIIGSTGIKSIDKLGGLVKKLPVLGICFFTASMAISGLPPLNGFVSEFLAGFSGIKGLLLASTTTPSAIILFSLFIISGLALLCFANIFGIIFLGEPRSFESGLKFKSSLGLELPQIIICVFIICAGLVPQFLLFPLLIPVVNIITGQDLASINSYFIEVSKIFNITSILFSGIAFILAIVLIKKFFADRKKRFKSVPTWDCGYIMPNPKMQYTAASFSSQLRDFFKFFLQTKKQRTQITGFFPENAEVNSRTSDLFQDKIYKPFYKLLEKFFSKAKIIQHGKLHLYMLSIMIVLIFLLFWKL